MSTCQGCGTLLPPKTWTGRNQKWCSQRCRRDTLYVHHCVDCGKRLNSSDGYGPNAPKRCVKCSGIALGRERKVWTREPIIAAIQDWAETYGHFPTCLEWSPTHARNLGCPEKAADYLREPNRWPHHNTVLREFGTWRAGIEAAGFVPRERGNTLAQLARKVAA